jgi:hypothetical protein
MRHHKSRALRFGKQPKEICHPAFSSNIKLAGPGCPADSSPFFFCYHLLAMYSPIEMHDYTWTQLLKDNPEWATVVFSAFTTLVIVWQVIVMILQGRGVDRREHQQNRLIRLQFDHSLLIRMNAEREKILHMAREVHHVAGCLTLPPMTGGESFWEELPVKTYELNQRLRILDLGAYTGPNDTWYFQLEEYINDLVRIIGEDNDFQKLYEMDGMTPADSTRVKLKEAENRHNPIGILLDIEKAMRLEFFEFKGRLDSETND